MSQSAAIPQETEVSPISEPDLSAPGSPSRNRLLALLIILLAGLSCIFLLPKSHGIAPSGVELQLPAFLGEWYGEDQPISEKEYLVLARDTEFARKVYRNGRGAEIFTSIVMSGHDLDNSIHRPERCLPAQGWSVADSKSLQLPVATSADGTLPVTRLYNVRSIVDDKGAALKIYNLNYYWFVGSQDITASHMERTYMDIRDRIIKGYNQRWAYITVAATITEGLTKFGLNEKQTDELVQKFIADLTPQILRRSDG